MSDSSEIKKRKLSLDRETLTVMTADDLANVNGGTWGQAIKQSIKWSVKSVRVVSEVFGISTAVKEGADMIKGQGGNGGGNNNGGMKDGGFKQAPQTRIQATPGNCVD